MYTHKEIVPYGKLHVGETVEDESKLSAQYELQKCVTWIQQINAKRVCVQFSSDQLPKAPQLVHLLETRIGQKLYILGDTSYGSCCVDEVAAQHVNADGIIHFGHACLSPSERIPVLYIFNKEYVDVSDFVNCFHKMFKCDEPVLLLCDVSYYHAIDSINQFLKTRNTLIVGLIAEGNITPTTHTVFGRVINVPHDANLNDYHILYIGKDGPSAANFKYLFPGQPFFMYNPVVPTVIEKYEVNVSKFLQRRMFLIESLKNARNLGVLIGTLCVKSYLQAVERIKCLTKPRGIKCYIISVGKINVPKLANFLEMDAYVLISCAENSLLDCKEFLQPIVTPYEIELAFNTAYKWSEKFVTDFTTLLPGCSNYVQEELISLNTEANVSLVSGHLQRTSLNTDATEDLSTDLVPKGIGALATTQSHGCSFLTSRSWVGLEPKLGETPVTMATPGRSGIPFKYENEQLMNTDVSISDSES